MLSKRKEYVCLIVLLFIRFLPLLISVYYKPLCQRQNGLSCIIIFRVGCFESGAIFKFFLNNQEKIILVLCRLSVSGVTFLFFSHDSIRCV